MSGHYRGRNWVWAVLLLSLLVCGPAAWAQRAPREKPRPRELEASCETEPVSATELKVQVQYNLVQPLQQDASLDLRAAVAGQIDPRHFTSTIVRLDKGHQGEHSAELRLRYTGTAVIHVDAIWLRLVPEGSQRPVARKAIRFDGDFPLKRLASSPMPSAERAKQRPPKRQGPQRVPPGERPSSVPTGRRPSDAVVAIEPLKRTMRADSLEVRVAYNYTGKRVANAKIVVMAMRDAKEPQGFARGEAPAQTGRNTETLRIEYSGERVIRTNRLVAFLAGPGDKPYAGRSILQDKVWGLNPETLDRLTFEVQSRTGNTLEARVRYRYVTRHGNPALLKVERVEKDGQRVRGMISKIQPLSVAQGSSGEAKLTITYAGYQPAQTDRITLALVDQRTREAFHSEEFDLVRTWAPAPRDAIYDVKITPVDGDEIEVAGRYFYNTDHGRNVVVTANVYSGATSLAHFHMDPKRVPISRGEGSFSFRLVYDWCEKVVPTDRLQLNLCWLPPKSEFYTPFETRNIPLEKKWIAGPRTVTGTLTFVNAQDRLLKIQDSDGLTWNVTTASFDQARDAVNGAQATYTGLRVENSPRSITEAVQGDQWAKEVWGDVIMKKGLVAKLRDVRSVVYEVTFKDAAECEKIALYDYVGAQGTPKRSPPGITEATCINVVKKTVTLQPLGDKSITDETGFDLAAQLSRTMLQNMIDSYLDAHPEKLGGPTQNVQLDKPTLNFYASREDRIRVIINVTRPMALELDLEVPLEVTADGDVVLKFTAIDDRDARLGDEAATEEPATSAAAKAWQTLGEHLRNKMQDVSLPLGFIKSVIGTHQLYYDPTTHVLLPDTTPSTAAGAVPWPLAPEEWRLKVAPTDREGEGWLYLGATVLLGPDDERGYGYWSTAYDFAAPSRHGAVVISTRLMDSLLATVKPRPLPKAYSISTSMSLESFVADVDLRLLIIDELEWGYSPGQLAISWLRIDLYKIDLIELLFWDEVAWLDTPSVGDPGDPGDRAMTHGVDIEDIRATFSIPNKSAPKLSLNVSFGPDGHIKLRGMVGDLIDLISPNLIVNFVDQALKDMDFNLLNLSFDLSQTGLSGKILLNELDATRPQDTILRVQWRP